MLLSLATLSVLATGALSCDPGRPDIALARRIQPGSTEALAYPTRELEWSDVNFLHTTDSHGWLSGHQKATAPEPNSSGDFGDFASFVAHMKAIAIEKDVDLLLIDSGDLHDGNGLSDAGALNGAELDGVRSDKIFQRLPYDVLAIGNHEAYIYNITKNVHEEFAPSWGGRYLSSNMNITLVQDGKNVSVPVGGNRFSKFKTRKGKKVTALGVLFNFTGQAKGVTVQSPAAMVNETWFAEAIQELPDFFVVAGHMPVIGKRGDSDFDLVLGKIRTVHPNVPVYIFGGHSHIRACQQLDNRSMSLESGRYMETVGFMSSNLPASNYTGPLEISRRYLDPNRNTYAWHTKDHAPIFDTVEGLNITAQLYSTIAALNVSSIIGTNPKDLFLQRSSYGSNDSLLTYLTSEVLPKVIVDETRANRSKIVIVNSGSQRYDLYQGPFIVNDNFVVSPFLDNFKYFSLPFRIASKILDVMNHAGAAQKRSMAEEDPFKHAQRVAWENHVRASRASPEVLKRASELTLGYVTTDSCPGLGDDILHSPIPFVSDIPTYISTALPSGLGSDDLVDVVYLDFFASSIAPIVNALDSSYNLTAADAKTYGPPADTLAGLRTDKMWGVYAAEYWN